MPIASNLTTGPYTANGSQTAFAFTFTVVSPADVQVQVNGAAISPSLYTVAVNADGTGTVTFSVAPANGAAVLLVSNPDFAQETIFETEGAYSLAQVNQINRRDAVRANWLAGTMLQNLPDGWPTASNRAGKFLSWNASGVPIYTDGAGSDSAMRSDLASSLAIKGSALVSQLAGGAGAVARTVQAKLRDIVSVKDFGAVGNGITDDTASIQAALNTGKAILFPDGLYRCTAKITSSDKPVAIYTDGNVRVNWTAGASSQGFEFTFSNITNHTLYIGDIELSTEVEGGGTPIKATWPTGATGYARLCELGKIVCRGADIPGQVGYWAAGVDLENAWIAYCETVDFYGKLSGTTPLSGAAVIVRGTTTDAKFHIRARACQDGLRIAGFSELVDISGSIFVACDYAVNCSGTAGLNTPGFLWLGGHCSTFKGGVRSVNILQGNISDILVYKRPDSNQNFIAFDLDSASTDWQITDCKVFSLGNPGGGTTTAVRDAGTNNKTKGIRNVSCNTDLNLVSGASGFEHEFSRSDNARGAITAGSINGQVTVTAGGGPGSSTNYFDTLTANAAAPSILGFRRWGDGAGYFLTANSSATTITNLTGGFPGDEIVIQANDDNTTLQHNSGLQLDAGINRTLASGEIVRLRRITSSSWKQVGGGSGVINVEGTDVVRTVQQKLAETVSVGDFGAKGDGVTDDAPAIQAAIDLVSVTGGTVHFPKGGVYLINTPLVIKNLVNRPPISPVSSDIHFQDLRPINLVSDGLATIKAGATMTDMVEYVFNVDTEDLSPFYSTVRGIGFDGNGLATNCLYSNFSMHMKYEKNRFWGYTGAGIRVVGYCVSQFLYNVFKGPTGILLNGGGGDSIIQHNDFYFPATGAGTGINFGQFAGNTAVLNNIFTRAEAVGTLIGVRLSGDIVPSAGFEVRHVLIEGNEFSGLSVGVAGRPFNSSTRNTYQCMIRANHVTPFGSTNTGVLAELVGCENIIINDNWVGKVDFPAATATEAILLNNCIGIEVFGNQFENLNGRAVAMTDCLRCRVNDNRMTDCGKAGAGFTIIDVAGNSQHNEFKNNYFYQSSTSFAQSGIVEFTGANNNSASDNRFFQIIVPYVVVGANTRFWRQEAGTAMPTDGRYHAGDYVENVAPTVLGTSPNQYVISRWLRITSGTGHVLNTDWVQARTFTGT